MEIILESEFDIERGMREFVNKIGNAKVFAIYAGMGVGKTTCIKEICKQLGVVDEVTSPTFAIINEYKTERDDFIYHFDLYRLETIEEAHNIGVEEYLYSGRICFIEWPELIESILPESTVRVDIQELSDGKRKISLHEQN
ncbi:MAG: tRNA (adenosine(37)-N6)-threonylcarbamoyltransferase complex ATPase subunit type 1 TsaE [Bacteroidales bacterium]|jgi:tRNA threonylcarbamoyladenosine biosynthesis protein TsaE|nr:tRNA (adenosine(37)-N6)-threonylcarbamoyltransferase complex ATPase subunit type 1 TsaE [Bacteroidales bacterium]